MPIASSSPNFSQGLGHVASQSGNSALGHALDNSTGDNAIGAANPGDSGFPGTGSFLSSWQAMLASLEGPTGEWETTGEGETTREGEKGAISSTEAAAAIAGRASNGISGKGSAGTVDRAVDSAPNSSSQTALTSSADRLARLQQLVAQKAAQTSSATGGVGSASKSASLRATGIQPSRSGKASAGSESSNGAMASAAPSGGDQSMAANMAAGHASQAAQNSAQGNDTRPAVSRTGFGPSGLAADAAFSAHNLAVSSTNGESIAPAGLNAKENESVEPSRAGSNASVDGGVNSTQNGSGLSGAGEGSAEAIPNEANLIDAVNGPADQASVAISADALSHSDPSSAASSSSATRRAGSGSSSFSDSSARSVQRGERVSGVGAAAGPAVHNLQIAQGNSTPSTLAQGAYPLAVSGAGAGSASSSASGSAVSANPASAGETFAALDGGSSDGRVSWTHTGANRAEAGFEDPSLGWVGVRADLGGGGVHASLVPGSAEASQTLGSHLAGLNSYLAERHPGVSPVTVAAEEHGGTSGSTHPGSGNESGTQSETQSGSQSSTSQQDSSGNPDNGWMSAGPDNTAIQVAGRAHTFPSPLPTSDAGFATQQAGKSSGSYISVMA